MAYIASNIRMSPLGASYNDDTPCGAIPAGDPYRSPGHWCMYAGQMLQFDDAGNVHPDPVNNTVTPGPGSVLNKITSAVPGGAMTLVGVAAVGAFLLLRKKK